MPTIDEHIAHALGDDCPDVLRQQIAPILASMLAQMTDDDANNCVDMIARVRARIMLNDFDGASALMSEFGMNDFQIMMVSNMLSGYVATAQG